MCGVTKHRNVVSGALLACLLILAAPIARADSGLTVNSTSLLFAQTGATLPASQMVSVFGVNGVNQSFTVQAAVVTPAMGTWLTVTAMAGTSPTSLTVSANGTGLATGMYNGTVTLTTSLGTLVIPVELDVTTVSGLSVTPGTLLFQQTGTTLPPSQMVAVTATGAVSLSFTVQAMTTSGGNWLTVTPATGTSPATLTISGNGTGLAAGAFHGSIVLTTSQGTLTIPVELDVLAAGTGAIVVKPDELEFKAVVGGPAPNPKTVSVSNPTTASFSWTAVAAVTTPAGGHWLTVTPASGTGAGVLMVAVDPTGLAQGDYTGTVKVTSGGSTATVKVSLEVEKGEDDDHKPGLRLEPEAIHFEFEPNSNHQTLTRQLEVNVQGRSSVSWTASASVETPAGGKWLSVIPATGSGQGKIAVTADPTGLAAGMYSGMIKVDGGAAGSDTTRVFLDVRGPAQPRVIVSPRSVRFQFSQATKAVTPASKLIDIKSKATGLTFTAAATTASGGNWLKITPTSGNVPGSVTASVDPAVAGTLSVGLYTGNVAITTPGASQPVHNVHVALRVVPVGEPPELEVEPGTLIFKGVAGGTNPAAQTVKLEAEGAASIAWTAAASTAVGGAWLTVTPTTGTATPTASTATVNVNIAGLAAGTYAGAVVFTPAAASGAPIRSVLVKLVVATSAAADITVAASDPQIAASMQGVITSPSEGFTTQVGLPVDVMVTVLDSNGNGVEGATVIAASSGSEPQLVLDDLGGGQYEALFRPMAGGSETLSISVNGSVQSAVTGTVSSQTLDVIFQGGVVNAASFAPSPTPIAAGSLASVFGLNIAAQTAAASRLPLPTSMGGVTVTVGGIPAPLITLNTGTNDQINFQIPFELSGAAMADVVVNNNGMISAPETINLGVAPALFTVTQDGAGAGAFLHADFTPVTASRPARRGEILLLFGTGFGSVSPAGITGAAAGQATVNGNVTAAIGGQNSAVSFAGLAPGFAGLFQVNVQVPSAAVSGVQSISVSVNGVSATGRATVQVQ